MTAAVAVRPPPARRKAPRPAAPTPALRVPLSPRRVRQVALVVLAAIPVAAAIAAALALGAPEKIMGALTAATVRAGLEVRSVQVTGARHLDRAAILDAVLAGAPSTAMLALDVEAARTRLLALPWVSEATVARRLPDRLEIAVVERAPAALWQHQRRLRLVDAGGQVLSPADPRRFASLPLVVGEDANSEMPSLTALLSSRPALARQVEAAIWVGKRRWDLRMKSGETLALPEGYAAAETALSRFVALNAEQRLLGRGYARFDLRLPGKMVVRVTDRPGAVAEAADQAVPI